jgi:hypothetical protein
MALTYAIWYNYMKDLINLSAASGKGSLNMLLDGTVILGNCTFRPEVRLKWWNTCLVSLRP